MKSNMISDISALTTIGESSLEKLVDKTMWCICNDVYESVLSRDELTEIDIGIGNLDILIDDGEMHFRFTPNKKLEESLRITVMEKKNPLVLIAEKSLAKRITNAYKEYI